MIYMGIDPGAKGAVAAIGGHLDVVCLADFPGNEPDLAGIIRRAVAPSLDAGDIVIAAIEKVGAFPGQGVTSMFSLGLNFGVWRGILAAFGIPFEIVTPLTWQKPFFSKADGKSSAYNVARRLFPAAELTGKRGAIKDGRADALCIAYWLYLRHHKASGDIPAVRQGEDDGGVADGGAGGNSQAATEVKKQAETPRAKRTERKGGR